MKPQAGTWRADVLFGALGATLVVLCVRLGVLTVKGGDFARPRLQRQQIMVVPRPGRPGSIYAATLGSYVALAVSRQEAVCFADPNLLARRLDDEKIANACVAIGEALSLDAARIQTMLVARRGDRFVPLKAGLSPREIQAVCDLGLGGVGIRHDWRREYPGGDLAATVIGFRHDCALAGMPPDRSGGGGLELGLEQHLAGVDGCSVLLTDARRRPLWEAGQRLPRDGDSVLLCLDAVVQEQLQAAVAGAVEQYSAKWGAGVVIEPRSGEVLAMCSAPSFDPGDFERADAAARTNRAVCVPYEPGSAFKPIMTAAAVDAGAVSYETQLFCENGEYHAARGGRLTDHGQHYGMLTVEDIVVHSSNIGMAKVGEKLGNAAQFEAVRRFGFDARTGICLPGESPGIVRELRKWDGYSLRRVPFGQEISVTTLQLAMAFGVFANGGLLMEPQLVREIRRPDGSPAWRLRPRVVRRVLKPCTAEQTLAVLQQAVERGTGKSCRLDRWTSWGKTGTAQIPGPGGYVPRAYVATFVGGAPAVRPQVVCAISIYWPDAAKGYYGGKVAAPAVRQVLERTLVYLNVPPDRAARDRLPAVARTPGGW